MAPSSGRTLFGVLVILVLGAYNFITGGTSVFRGLATERWPSTDGVVTSTTVTSHQGGGRYNRRTYWSPVIEYRYDVNDVRYSCRRLSFYRVSHETRGAAEEVTSYFPIGGKVKVYYDPGRPGEAVLQRGTSRNDLGLFSLGLILLGGGALWGWTFLGPYFAAGKRTGTSDRYPSVPYQPDAFLK